MKIFVTTLPDDHVTETGRTISELKALCEKLPAKDIENRPIYIDPPKDLEIPNNAVIVFTSWPNGFRARVFRAIWAEAGKGVRSREFKQISITSNKDTSTRWCAPDRLANYREGVPVVVWREDKGHYSPSFSVVGFTLWAAYPIDKAREDFANGNSEQRNSITTFLTKYDAQISEDDKKHVAKYLKMMDDETARLQAEKEAKNAQLFPNLVAATYAA